MKDAAENLPFHTTESEKRIIRELLATANLREKTDWPEPADQLRGEGIDSAAKYITYLRENLFPQETRLLAERTKYLKPLQADFLRVHADQTLETPTLTLNARIRNATEYRLLVEKLQAFDFTTWAAYCNQERADGD